MDTIRAVSQMAIEEVDHAAGARTAGAAHLDRVSPGLAEPVLEAIQVTAMQRMQPDADRATQTRLASAVERHAATREPGAERRASFDAIMKDYLLQEAAGARLEAHGLVDPLERHADRDTARSSLRAAETLKRHGVSAHAIFDRASHEDMQAIASGSYDRIAQEHTRFAVSSQLRLTPRAMATPAAQPVIASPRTYPAAGATKGPMPIHQHAVGFGRKGVAER